MLFRSQGVFVSDASVSDGSISSDELANSIIVKSTGNGLRLTAEQVLLAHFKAESLTGRVLGRGALQSSNFSAGSLSTGKIDDGSLLGQKIKTYTLTSSALANQAILTSHIPDYEIPNNSIALATFNQSEVLQITGDEIEDLTGSKVASSTLIGQDVESDFTSREIGSIETDNIKNLTFDTSSFSTNAVTRGHFITSAAITLAKFSNSEVPSSRLEFASIGFSKLNTDETKINSLFFENNADSQHTHAIATQELLCPGSITVDSGASLSQGNSFCMSSTTATLSVMRDRARTLTVDSKIVRARVCTLEQLWKARKDGNSFSNPVLSSNFHLKPQGFAGQLKILKFNLDDNGDGTVLEEGLANNVSHETRLCF